MGLTKKQKRVVQSALLCMSETRMLLSHQLDDAMTKSIKLRTFDDQIRTASEALHDLLKNREIKKKLKALDAKLEKMDDAK